MHGLFRLSAPLFLTFALAGCHRDEHRYVTRVSNGGSDLLDSTITANARKIRFDCRASDSGQCHYSLFSHGCAAGDPCLEQPFLHLIVKAGQAQAIDAPAGSWHPCVSQRGDAKTSSCRRTRSVAIVP